MPRLPRIYLENCLYYITSRANQGQEIFKDGEDYKMYLELLKKYKEQFGFKLFSFLLGKEQISLLMEVGEGATISVIMHGVSSNYTKYFNNRYQKRGHLFQERFRSVVVEKKPYLLDLISYIHLNPANQSLYSSHLLYLYNNQNQDEAADKIRKILNLEAEVAQVTEAILRVCPDKKGYADFIAGYAPEEIEAIRKKLHRTNILGSEQFMEKAKAELEKKAEPESQEKGFPFMPVSVSIVVMLAGIGLGVLYIQKNVAPKKRGEVGDQAIKERFNYNNLTLKQGQVEQEEKSESPDLLLDLDDTEWTIELEGPKDITVAYPRFDKIAFSNGKISSLYFMKSGFGGSNYTLTVQDRGKMTWETMQASSSGGVLVWRADIEAGRMQGTLSLREAGKPAQEFSFVSLGYRRKE